METPYGPCGHTHYEGSQPCIHLAYLRGFEDGQRSAVVFELPCKDNQDAGLYDGER